MKVSPVLVVLHDLEAVGLHVAGIEELGGADLLGEVGDDLDGGGLAQRGPLPDLVANRRGLEARALVGGPLGLLGGAGGEPVALVGGSLGGLELRRQALGDGRDIPDERRRAVVVRGVGEIAVDVDDVLRVLVADARSSRPGTRRASR